MTAKTYRRVVVAARPSGEPKESDFRIETLPIPEPGPKEVLVRAIYLSLDPYMRGRLRDVPSYAPPVGIGEVMVGGVVGEVVKSYHPAFKAGEFVEGRMGWQEYAVVEPSELRKVDPALAPISTANGVLGMPGLTAYFGLFSVAEPKPGETVAISAASGAVGQVAGQLAKIMGCRAVGIAGGQAKCDFVQRELGFDACVDYKAGDLDAALRAACPAGIDVYFENVGGPVSDAVFRQLNMFARIAACGSVSQANNETPAQGPRLLGLFTGRRVRLQGFIVSDFRDHNPAALRRLGQWVKSGRIKYREDIVDGIERAPAAFIGLLRGENFGKLQVRLGPEA
ncbi:MAG: NADP-dependent oxidoreductase [Alphaproteobacteria bacterium]|nr:NADP-dependent oxidoreductase [Alphaproteobacteria bacterium]